MKLSDIKRTLAERNLQLTKSLGQNFLHDGNQLRRIVEAAELGRNDRLLEIGPGLGPLTERLLAEAGSVLAVEKDGRLVEVLRERFAKELAGDSPALQLFHADALAWLKERPRDWTGWKLVANLPYSVASPILVELAQAHHGPDRLVATLQIEVAQRLMATPESEHYGILTLLMQLHYEPRGSFKIPANCFFPAPDVDSACVCLVRRAQPLLDKPATEVFCQVVKRAFSQRRKMMFKLLREHWPPDRLERAFAAAGLDPSARAESASLQQFVVLTRSLHE